MKIEPLRSNNELGDWAQGISRETLYLNSSGLQEWDDHCKKGKHYVVIDGFPRACPDFGYTQAGEKTMTDSKGKRQWGNDNGQPMMGIDEKSVRHYLTVCANTDMAKGIIIIVPCTGYLAGSNAPEEPSLRGVFWVNLEDFIKQAKSGPGINQTKLTCIPFSCFNAFEWVPPRYHNERHLFYRVRDTMDMFS